MQYDFFNISPQSIHMMDAMGRITKKNGAILAMLFVGLSMVVIGTVSMIPSIAGSTSPVDPYATLSGSTMPSSVVFRSPTPFADYQARLDLDYTFPYSLFGLDGTGVRFTDVYGTDLSFWIEKWNVESVSTIWIKIPIAGTTNITMSCDGVIMGSRSNGSATFPFFDDFTGSSIDNTKWITGNTVYGSVSWNPDDDTVTVQSSTPANCRMSTFEGFHDGNASGSAYGIYLSRGVYTANGGPNTLNGTTGSGYASTDKQSTEHSYDPTWSTKEYLFVNSTLSRFSLDNDAWSTMHTTHLPQAPVPVNFFARGMYYGGGENHGAWLRSKLSWFPDNMSGYAMRTLTNTHYDYTIEAGADPCYIIVDWVFVRRVASTDTVTTLTSPSNAGKVTAFVGALIAAVAAVALVTVVMVSRNRATPTVIYRRDYPADREVSMPRTSVNNDIHTFCPVCGNALPSGTEHGEYCGFCGAPLDARSSNRL